MPQPGPGMERAQMLIREILPGLIILDWMLLGMSGIEFSRKLKGDELTKAIPITMLTARGEETYKVSGWKSGRMTISPSLSAR